MARRGRGRDRLTLNAEINVVSLIDVMMLLMIIFMITAPMMQGGVDISLPKAQSRPLESLCPEGFGSCRQFRPAGQHPHQAGWLTSERAN